MSVLDIEQGEHAVKAPNGINEVLNERESPLKYLG
jgi:hypothetical protein